MTAQLGEVKKNELFEEIIIEISENGKSLITSLKGRMSSETFYVILKNDEEKAKRYARACEDRAEKIADEIIEIADHTEEDHTAFTGMNVVNRDKLRVDARKWILAKLHPKKYGDKIDLSSSDGTMAPKLNIVVQSEKTASEINKLAGENDNSI